MKRRRISKAAKHRLVVLVPVTVIVVSYFLISLSYYMIKIYNLKKEEATLNIQLNQLKETEEDLKTDIEKLKNPDYLARYARAHYHYSKEGELVIQRSDTESSSLDEVETENNRQALMTICIIGLVIVAFYIMRHRPKKR